MLYLCHYKIALYQSMNLLFFVSSLQTRFSSKTVKVVHTRVTLSSLVSSAAAFLLPDFFLGEMQARNRFAKTKHMPPASPGKD